MKEADIVLASLGNYYNFYDEHKHNPERRVESYGWIQDAVEAGQAVFTAPKLPKLPGPKRYAPPPCILMTVL